MDSFLILNDKYNTADDSNSSSTQIAIEIQPFSDQINVQKWMRRSTYTTKEDQELMLTFRSTNADGTVSTLYKCAVCADAADTYTDIEDLKEHLVVHKKFKCKTCRKRFYKPSYLNTHLRQAHRPDQKLQCPNCDKTFRQRYCLEQHLFIHSNKKHFQCSFADCGKKFKHVNTMLCHERIHYQDNRKQCPECGKMCTRLEIHMGQHKPEQRHKCEECQKSYVTAASLVKHVRSKHQAKTE